MSSVPDGLTIERNRDLEGLDKRPWTRRALVVLLCVPLALALLNVFGQRPQTTEESVGDASLSIYAPERVRGGLNYEARFHIVAHSDLADARLVLDSNWAEGITINTIEPSPIGEGSHDGKLVLELGHVPRGEKYVLYIQSQVNPTNVGRRSQDVSLYDGKRLISTIDRRVTIFP